MSVVVKDVQTSECEACQMKHTHDYVNQVSQLYSSGLGGDNVYYGSGYPNNWLLLTDNFTPNFSRGYKKYIL